MNKLTSTFLALILGTTFVAHAQKTSGGYFEGTARALVSNQSVLDNPADSSAESTGGYTLFDLGINAVRDNTLKINSILRVKNEFGGFFGDGVFFEFRQLRLEGLIGEKLKYEIGDLDLKNTKYTFFNSDVDYTDYESEMFTIKRNVINYENFFTDENTWRTQGVNLFTTFKFDKGIETMRARVYGNRVAKTDLVNIPDRFLYGADFKIKQSENLKLGLNVVAVSDIASTIDTSGFGGAGVTTDFDNEVFSFTIDYNRDLNDDLAYVFNAELGTSMTSAIYIDSSVSYNGGFFDVSTGVEYKPMGLTFNVGYKSVDHDFNSPAAQTRRIYDNAIATPFILQSGKPVGFNRTASLWDRTTMETGLYNSKSISSVLIAYNPVYGNINPYGAATPNRQGLTVNIGSSDDSTKLYDVQARIEMMSEKVGVGALEKRSFMGIQVGGRLMINQLLAKENMIAIHGGIRRETTNRDGVSAIDLTSTQMDIGIDVEPIKRLHVMAAIKSVNASGNEYFLDGGNGFARNVFNQISSNETFSYMGMDVNDMITGIGFKYVFSDNADLSIQGNFVKYDSEWYNSSSAPTTVSSENAYDMNQIYFLYNQTF